jgi:hypothetical protein
VGRAPALQQLVSACNPRIIGHGRIVTGEESVTHFTDHLHVGIANETKTVTEAMPFVDRDCAGKSRATRPEAKWRMLDQSNRRPGKLCGAGRDIHLLRRLRFRLSGGEGLFARPHCIGRTMDNWLAGIVTEFVQPNGVLPASAKIK